MTCEERIIRARQRVERAVAQTLAAIDDAESRIASGGAISRDPLTEGVAAVRELLLQYVGAARSRARAEQSEPKPAAQVADRFPVGGGQGGGAVNLQTYQ